MVVQGCAPMSVQRDTGFQPVQAARTEGNRRFRGHLNSNVVGTAFQSLEKPCHDQRMIVHIHLVK